MMGYDIKTVDLTYTDRKVLREAAGEVLANPKSTVIKSVLRNAVNKLRWADAEDKPTEAGRPALYAAPAAELPEPRTGVKGQPFEGDIIR
jgi:hypothetical protein